MSDTIQIVSKKYPESIQILSGYFDQMDSAIDFEKNKRFFQFLLTQIILFLFEIEFYVKNSFIRGIAC